MHSKSYITVRYAETDKMGIVHHSVYPVWYEIGRADLVKMFDYTYDEIEKLGIMMPLTNVSCNYKYPAFYPDKVLIRTWVIHLTPARIEFRYTVNKINDDGTEIELGYGTTEHGFVDSKTFRPCSLKKRLPQLFEKMKATF